MGGRGGAGAQGPLGLEQQIKRAYDDVAPEAGDWVNLADIRERLPKSFSRQQVDEALRGLEQLRSVNIVPQANQKALSQRTRDAAVVIGGEPKQFIAMGLD